MAVAFNYSTQSRIGGQPDPILTYNPGRFATTPGPQRSQASLDRTNEGAANRASQEAIAKYQADAGNYTELHGRYGLPGGGSETIADRRLKEQNQFNYATASLPWNYRKDVFNQTFPLIQGLVGQNGSFNGQFGTVGGANTPQPNLPDNFVYTGDQIQQQVNAARAQGDAGAQVEKNTARGELAGRGFSTRSPIAMAMDLAADSGARASNADQERQIRFDAAGANANQALNVGKLAQDAWSGWNDADIRRRQTQLNALLGSQSAVTNLISALGGLG